MNFTIRDVTPEDSKQIVDILNSIIDKGGYTVFDTKFTEKTERDYIKSFPSRGIFLIAENSENKMLGFHSLEPFASYTNAFNHVGLIGTFLHLKHRSLGIGSALLTESFNRGKTMSYEKYFAYVRADNQESLNFHLKHGFEVIGTSKKQAKINGKYIDEILMEKFL